jgi:hypothetical protein
MGRRRLSKGGGRTRWPLTYPRSRDEVAVAALWCVLVQLASTKPDCWRCHCALTFDVASVATSGVVPEAYSEERTFMDSAVW